MLKKSRLPLLSRGLFSWGEIVQYYGTRLSENISRRFRILNRRDSPLGSSLVSDDLSPFEISATGGRKGFALRSFRLIN